jgi:hypothetical protein
MARRSEAKPR